MQVALELAPLFVAGLDDAGTGGLQVLARLRTRDRERGELGERHQPRLAVVGQRLAGRDRDGAPGNAADEDGRCDGRAVPDLPHRRRNVGVEREVVVDARGQAGVAGAADRGVVVGEDAVADAEDVDVLAIVPADDRRGVVALVAEHRRRADPEHARSLLRDGGEHALRRRFGRNERGDAPQGPLLLGQPPDLRELRLDVTLERPLQVLGHVDAGRDEVAAPSSAPGISLFDHAIRRRPPSFVSQFPTCGLESPVLQMYARTSPNASASSAGMTTSRASRPMTSSRLYPVERTQESLKRTMRPSQSRTQTSA